MNHRGLMRRISLLFHVVYTLETSGARTAAKVNNTADCCFIGAAQQSHGDNGAWRINDSRQIRRWERRTGIYASYLFFSYDNREK